MSDLRPVQVFSLKVPPGGALVECNPGVPASLRITMAAIDPSEEIGEAPPRATLKIIHNVLDFMEGDEENDEDDEDEDEDIDDADIKAIERRLGIVNGENDDEDDDEDEDMEEDDEDEDEDDSDDEEMANGGPSDPEKRRTAQETAFLKALAEEAEDIDEETHASLVNRIAKADKGKGRALNLGNNSDDISDGGMEEYVVCTLDRNMAYQQPLDITIREDEEVYFRVSGSQTIYLTGNFVVPPEDIANDDDDEDLDEDALLGLNGLNGVGDYSEDDSIEDDSELDALDALVDPRVVELVSEDDEEAPKLVKAKPQKSKNKRAAEDDAEVESVPKKAEEPEKRQNKKLKTNAGEAVPGAEVNGKDSKKSKKEKAAKKEEATPQANGKKVQFAEKLEQGPTPSKNAPPTKGPRNVNGVMVDDKKAGTGPAAKKGDRVGLRYIGKLKDNKVFDSNKSGKPFTFKLGSGEVIKGWDIGVVGMTVGSERRITIPAHLAYGGKKMPGIPANSDLTFDLKAISIN